MMQAAETAGITAMADALVASGSVSREQASQMLAAEIAAAGGNAGELPVEAGDLPLDANPGTLSEAPGAGQEATRSQPPPANPLAEIEIDPLFAPPDTPDGYQLTLNPKVPMTVADVQAVREWFHTLRLPQPIAQSLYSEVERMSRQEPDAAAIDRMNLQTMASLRQAWGERTDTMLGHARRLISEAAQTHPYLNTALARGPGSNAVVVRQLAEHAARLYAPERGA